MECWVLPDPITPSLHYSITPFIWEEIRAQVLQPRVGAEGDDHLAGSCSGSDAKGAGDVGAGGEAGEDAFPGGEAPGGFDRFGVGDGEEAVAERGVPEGRDGGVAGALDLVARVR